MTDKEIAFEMIKNNFGKITPDRPLCLTVETLRFTSYLPLDDLKHSITLRAEKWCTIEELQEQTFWRYVQEWIEELEEKKENGEDEEDEDNDDDDDDYEEDEEEQNYETRK